MGLTPRTTSGEEGSPTASAELLRRAGAGDRAALEALLVRHRAPIERWARGRLPRWARDLLNTEDLVQEALLHTIRNLDAFRPHHDGAVQAYLRQAVLHRIQDEVRRVRRHPLHVELSEGRADGNASPLEEAVGTELLERYEGALARLAPEDREAIVGRVELNLPYDRLAFELGKPSPDAARVAVSRALVRLAKEMSGGR